MLELENAINCNAQYRYSLINLPITFKLLYIINLPPEPTV